MTKSFICAIGAAAIGFAAFASAPALAKTVKACEAEYQAGKAGLQKAGTKKTDFMTTCRAQPEAKAADPKADKAAAAADKKAKADAEKKAATDAKKAKADQAAAEKKAKADEKKAAAEQKKAKEPKTAAKPAATEKPAAEKPASTTSTSTRVEKPAPAKPAANEPDGKPGRVAFVARERACGADWKADKAAGKTGDQKWPQYWSDCNKRKKSEGM